YNLFRSHL
ncbi:unnamed protein product, partial [Adineta steineri]